MSGPSRRPRFLPPSWLRVFRTYLSLSAPLLLLILGLALAFASLASEVDIVYSTSFPGSLPPGNATLALPLGTAQFVEINMTTGGCSLRLYPATAAGWLSFNSTGVLPPTWIGCTNRTTTTIGDVQDLILVNLGNSSEAYNVTVLAYSIGMPYGWLGLPGTVLALAGLVLFVPRIAMREATRIRDEGGRRKKK